MIHRLAFFILLSSLLLSCGGSKEVAKSENSTPPPGWVSDRPISSSYYVGIGVAAKTPGTNFQKNAKENALSDLASEIKVNVNSNSLLYTLEREYKFEQEFRETIKTATDLDLEDFEIVDSWEDGNSYWVYYRLDKALYQAQIERKKKTAQELATDFLAKAQADENSGRYASAADYYLRGLQALEEFWQEEHRINYQGNSILLDNTLFSGLKSLLSNIEISIPESIDLRFQNNYKSDVAAQVISLEDRRPLEGAPIKYSYFGTYGRTMGSIATNVDGWVTIPVYDTDKEREDNNLNLEIDTEILFEAYRGDPFMKKLTESLRGHRTQKSINYIPPTVFIQSDEKSFGGAMEGQPIKSAVVNSLTRRGVRFVNSRSSADLVINILANTRKGGTSQGFSTALMNLEVNVIETTTSEIRYELSRSDIKGVDLNFEKASIKAYQNFTRNIESELMRKLVNNLL
jgi:hypothetical protein